MIDFGTFPEPRQLKASWSIETEQDLRWIHAMRHTWKWSWLWNWKAAWYAYQSWKFEQELVNAMADEIRKELDEAMIEVINNEYN